MALDYTPIRTQWPAKDSVITAFRYFLVSALVANKKVLELGCGAGEGAELLAAAASEYVGLDIEARWNASALPKEATFIQGDACDLPNEWSGQFDVVVALELVEHMQDTAALGREIRKVLAPGGWAIISTPNFDLLSDGCDDSRQPLFEHHLREYTHTEFHDYLTECGVAFSVHGLSQLPQLRDDPGAYAMVLGETVYHLKVGDSYPAIEVARTEDVPGGIPLCLSQSFLGVIGKDRPNLASGLSFGEGRLKESPLRKAARCFGRGIRSAANAVAALATPAAAARAPRRRAALCAGSVEWILKRRNDHLREFGLVLVNRMSRIQELEDVLASRDKHIEALGARIINLEAQQANTAGHVGNLEECLANRDEHIATLKAQLRQLEVQEQPNDVGTEGHE